MRDTRMPFGKYKGWPIYTIKSSYLIWLLEETDLKPHLEETVRDELAHRFGVRSSAHQSTPYNIPRIPQFVTRDSALQLITEGRRALARRNHPDVGGDAVKMTEINSTADWLTSALPNVMAEVRS